MVVGLAVDQVYFSTFHTGRYMYSCIRLKVIGNLLFLFVPVLEIPTL